MCGIASKTSLCGVLKVQCGCRDRWACNRSITRPCLFVMGKRGLIWLMRTPLPLSVWPNWWLGVFCVAERGRADVAIVDDRRLLSLTNHHDHDPVVQQSACLYVYCVW